MSDTKDKIVLFSGRFNPNHLSHVCSIIRLAKTFKKVIVVILDYDEREWPVVYTKQRFVEIFSEMPSLEVDIRVNNKHFGQITKVELEVFQPFDYYAAGNLKVLRHMERIGVPCIFVERAYLDQARDLTIPDD